MRVHALDTCFVTVKKVGDGVVSQLSVVLKLLNQILLECEDVGKMFNQSKLCFLLKKKKKEEYRQYRSFL